MKASNTLFRAFTYARRAHSIYFAILLNQISNSLIYYRLSIEHVPELKFIFPNFTLFFIIFTTVYSLTIVLIGKWDYEKGSLKRDQTLNALASPVTQDTIKASQLAQEGLLYHIKGDDELAVLSLQRSIQLLGGWLDE